jgi:hypothetical protein
MLGSNVPQPKGIAASPWDELPTFTVSKLTNVNESATSEPSGPVDLLDVSVPTPTEHASIAKPAIANSSQTVGYDHPNVSTSNPPAAYPSSYPIAGASSATNEWKPPINIVVTQNVQPSYYDPVGPAASSPSQYPANPDVPHSAYAAAAKYKELLDQPEWWNKLPQSTTKSTQPISTVEPNEPSRFSRFLSRTFNRAPAPTAPTIPDLQPGAVSAPTMPYAAPNPAGPSSLHRWWGGSQ